MTAEFFVGQLSSVIDRFGYCVYINCCLRIMWWYLWKATLLFCLLIIYASMDSVVHDKFCNCILQNECHMVWTGWQQGCKQPSQSCLLENGRPSTKPLGWLQSPTGEERVRPSELLAIFLVLWTRKRNSDLFESILLNQLIHYIGSPLNKI